MQTDWESGPTKPSLQVGKLDNTYDNFYDNENIDYSQAGSIKLGNIKSAGWLESSIFDAGVGADWETVSWDASTPSSGGLDTYTYVSSHSDVKGTVDNFANQQSASDGGLDSTLAERKVTGSGLPSTQNFETCTSAGSPCPPPVGWTSVSPALQSNTGTQNHTAGGTWSIRINAAGTGVLASDTVNYTGYINPDVSFWFRGTATAKGTTNLYYSISGEPWVLIFTQTPWDNDSAFHLYTVSDITALNGQSSVKFKWEFVRTAGTSNSCDDIQFTADAADTYDMEIYENINSVPSADTQTLQLRYELANTNDNFNVQVWNGSAWNTRGSTLTSTSWTDWSYTLLSNEVISGTVQVRFVDVNASSTPQDNILIDYLRVESQSAAWSTSAVVKLRTGDDSNPYDGGWSDWYQQSNGSENTFMGNGCHVQYRVELSTTNNAQTPVFNSITINYEEGPVIVDITLSSVPVNYGTVNPDAENNPATDNAHGFPMTIKVESTTNVNVDIYVKGTDWSDGSHTITVDKCHYDNDNVAGGANWTALTTSYATGPNQGFFEGVSPGTAKNIYWFIDIPAGQWAGSYSNAIYFKAAKDGTTP